MRLIRLAAIYIAAVLLLAGCSKDDDDGKEPQNNTPEPGLTAKIDDQEWEAMTSFSHNKDGLFTLNAGDFEGTVLFLTNFGQNIKGPGNYPNSVGEYGLIDSEGSITHKWSSVNVNLTITKLDTVKQLVSGTFSFTAEPITTTSATGQKKITNGVFTDVDIIE